MSMKVINYKSILKCKYINIVKNRMLVKSYEKAIKNDIKNDHQNMD